MRSPVTFYDWVREGGGKIYVVVTSAFASCFTLLQVLRLFGIDWISILKVPNTEDGWLMVNYGVHVVFIGYVAGATAYKFCQIKNPGSSSVKEWVIRDNLELQDPTSRGGEADSTDKKDKATTWVEFKLKVNKVVKQFTYFWLLAWGSWLFHYGYLFLEKIGPIEHYPSLRNFVNNLNSLMFIFMFMTLTVSTSKYGPLSWAKLVLIICLVSVVEWVAYHLVDSGKDSVTISFSILAGLFASIALAAFVGSIDSKFINVPLWLILSLYLYAAIQSLYIFFELEHFILKLGDKNLSLRVFVQRTQILITVFSFLLKTILFLAVTWILRTGRLVYFMAEEGSLNFKRDKNFAAFVERIELEEASIA
jgi:hypothetical protein